MQNDSLNNIVGGFTDVASMWQPSHHVIFFLKKYNGAHMSSPLSPYFPIYVYPLLDSGTTTSSIGRRWDCSKTRYALGTPCLHGGATAFVRLIQELMQAFVVDLALHYIWFCG